MIEFLPSTQQLIAAVAYPYPLQPDPKDPIEIRDRYPILEALRVWENALYERIPKDEYKIGTWPSTPELIASLRSALADQRGNYAGEMLAYVLVRCGCRQPDTMSSLCAWDAQLFRWQASGLTAESLMAKFRTADVAGVPNDEDLLKFQPWLANPAMALAEYSSWSLSGTLLKGRIVSGSLYNNSGNPDFAKLFREMAEQTTPSIPVSNVSQSDDCDPLWILKYTLGESTHSLELDYTYTPVDDKQLVDALNHLLIQQEHPSRVFRFGGGRNESPFWGHYIIAESQRFTSLCHDLCIPLHEYSNE